VAGTDTDKLAKYIALLEKSVPVCGPHFYKW